MGSTIVIQSNVQNFEDDFIIIVIIIIIIIIIQRALLIAVIRWSNWADSDSPDQQSP